MDAPVKEKDPLGHVNSAHSLSLAKRSTSLQGAVRAWRIAFLVFCTVGFLLSADLLRLHVRVHTDPNYHSFCAVTAYVDCEEVAFSGYAVFGGLPVALWGLLGYVFMGGLSIWSLRRNLKTEYWPFGLLFGFSAFAVAVSIVLFLISHYLIQSLCIVCIATYAVNIILCGLTIGELRQRGALPFSFFVKDLSFLRVNWRPFGIYICAFVTGAAMLWMLVPSYWLTEAATGPGGLLVGQSPEGAHWIGARKPTLEILEFSDYQCPYCLRGHAEVRSLVEMVPDKIRLVHRHFPLRSHPQAFNYAVLAYCAGRQNRFWEANDYLFTNGRRKTPVTAGELSAALRIEASTLSTCMAGDTARQAVADDVKTGRALGVHGTPTFIIGNKNYPGHIPESVFESLLSE
jgi:uncharacterized membrane protein